MWLSVAKPRLQLKLQSKKTSDTRLPWERQIASEGKRRLRAYAERRRARPCGLATLSQDCNNRCNQKNERYSLVMGEADCKRRQTPLASVSRAMQDETMWLSNAKPRLQPKLPSNNKFHHSALPTEADCKRKQTPLANVCRATHTKTMWLSNAKPRLQPKLPSNNKFHHSALPTEADCKRKQTSLANVC